MTTQSRKINGVSLVALVVTTAIGSGIFAMSSDLAVAAAPGAAIISWGIVGVGILLLAACFNNLLSKRSDLEGFFAYGKEGFGSFVGFISGWGYWMSAWLGNVAFATVCMSTLGYFFPVFQKGNSPISILVASIFAWSLTLLVNRGMESAALMNTVITVCKLIPIFTFIVVGIILFKANLFTAQFWGNLRYSFTIGGVLPQIRSSLMIMMWVFVGIEGATVLSARAKSRKTAGRATLIGVACLLLIYVMASIVPYGYMTRVQLAEMPHPAMVYIFQDMVGSWGGTFISIGLLISILGAWLSWTMLPAETMGLMAKQGLLPKQFAKKNKHGVPTLALMTTACMVQAFMIMLIFAEKAYEFAYSLCTASIVVCYIIVAAYQIKYSWQNRQLKGSMLQLWIGVGALIFQGFVLALAGLQYLFICLVVYVPGIILYAVTLKRNTGRYLNKLEWSATALIVSGAAVTIVLMVLGRLTV